MRKLSKTIWGAYELYGFIAWLASGTVSTVGSFLFFPFASDLPFLFKLLYGLVLFAGCLALSALFAHLLQVIFDTSAEVASIRQRQAVSSDGEMAPTTGIQAGRDIHIDAFNVGITTTKKDMPEIQVESAPEDSYARLRVSNNGSTAVFRADAQEIEGGKLIGSSWPIRWRGSKIRDMQIFKDSDHILDLAEADRWHIVPISHLDAPMREEDFPVAIRFHTAQLDVSSRQMPREYFDVRDKREIRLRIRITSDPPMASSYSRTWLLLREDGQWQGTRPSIEFREIAQ